MERKIGFEVREFMQLLNRVIDAQREESKIQCTHMQTRLLLFISKQPHPVFQKDIEKQFAVRRSTATEMLNILERDGLIVRQRVAYDARLKAIELTEDSKAIISVIERDIMHTEALLRKDVEASDLECFFKVLDQMKENMR